MGMGVSIVRFSMCSPTRVANPYRCVEIFSNKGLFKISHFPLFLKNLQPAVKQRYARAIIPTVFKSLQSFQDHRVSFTGPHVGNNSTHSKLFIVQSNLVHHENLKNKADHKR